MRSPQDKVHETRGTKKFMAPEVLAGRLYNTQADMFSMGVIVGVVHKGDPKSSHFERAERSLLDQKPDSRMTAPALYRWAKERWKASKQAGGGGRKDFKVDDVLRTLPAPFQVREVDTRGGIVSGNTSKLTAFILRQTIRVMQMFTQATKLRVTSVEYIFNPELYADFNNAKQDLKRSGRYKKREILTFHGTDPKNVKEYPNRISNVSNDSILTKGLFVGGEAGHKIAVGDKKVEPANHNN